MDAPHSNNYSQKEQFFLEQMNLNVNLDGEHINLDHENQKILNLAGKIKQLLGSNADIVIHHHEATPYLDMNISTTSKMGTTVEPFFDAQNHQNITFRPEEILEVCTKRVQEIQSKMTGGHRSIATHPRSSSSNVNRAQRNATTRPTPFTAQELQAFKVNENALINYPSQRRGPIILNENYIANLHFSLLNANDLKRAEKDPTKYNELINEITNSSIEEDKIMNGLINKILEKHPELNKTQYQHGLKIGAFLLTHKTHEDKPYNNSSIAFIFGLSIPKLNELEAKFLEGIKWELDMTKEIQEEA